MHTLRIATISTLSLLVVVSALAGGVYIAGAAFTGPSSPPPGSDGAIRADSSGNIGINIAPSASYKLYIDGDIGLASGDQVDFHDEVGDKVHWFSNTFGTGIELGTLTNWSVANHIWRIGGTSVSAGDAYMGLNNQGLTVVNNVTSTGSISGSKLCIGTSCQTSWPSGAWITSGSNIYYSAGKISVGSSATPNANTLLYIASSTAIGNNNSFGALLSIGATTADYPGDIPLATTNPNIILSGLNNTSIAFHDSGCCVSKIRYTANAFHVGEAIVGADPANLVLYNGLVLGSRTTSMAPAAVNGTIYYDTSLNKFRCYENSAWKDCIGSATYQ